LIVSSVCVYCGSSDLVAQKFKTSAQIIGTEIARRGLRLVFGGGSVGLMGIVADAVLKEGGTAVGIIPEHICEREVQHNSLTELHIVPDMHTRKRMMVDRADIFIVLPGGFGTLDETFEILTWKKLKLHNDPIFLFNQDGYWDGMIALINKMIAEGFSQLSDLNLFKVVNNTDELFAELDKIITNGKPSLTGQM
jgi:uncharacterized protein (TIGR00730 family)